MAGNPDPETGREKGDLSPTIFGGA